MNRTDVGGAFQQIVDANSQYYVLAYSPSDTRRDGRFRKLEVRVKRPGLKVVARQGYAVPKEAREAAAPPVPEQVPPTLRDALASPIPAGALGLRVTAPSFAAPGSKALVAVVVELDPARLAFAERDGTFGNEIDLVMVAVDENNKSADGKREQAPMRLSAATHQAVREHGFRLMRRLEVPPGRYQIR